MKSWHYIAIFIIFVTIVGGLIVYNVREINDIDTDMTQVQLQESAVQVKQEKIDVLYDVDFESDTFDEKMTDDVSAFTDVDDIIEEINVSF